MPHRRKKQEISPKPERARQVQQSRLFEAEEHEVGEIDKRIKRFKGDIQRLERKGE